MRIATTCLLLLVLGGAAGPVRADLWSTVYYPGWVQGALPASQIDFRAVTHVIHFSALAESSGGLNLTQHSLTAANSADIVSRGHASGKKVLVSVGGSDTASGFRSAASAAKQASFVQALVSLVSTRNYDGLDVDWEPLEAQDRALYTGFIKALRAALNAKGSGLLLTAAAATEPALFASLQGEFDQINLMTYDLSGPWPGWVTWFNAPLFDGGFRFPSTGGLVPSGEGMVRDFIAAGVRPSKLGLGIAFYGIEWSGGAGTSTGGSSRPRQTWLEPPVTTGMTYARIMSDYFQPSRYRWDTNAQAAYLTIESAGAADDRFISYDDEHTCQAKVSHARNRGLGGVMVWELGSAYRPEQPAGKRDPLLQAIRYSLSTPRFTDIRPTPQGLDLAFSTLPLGRYRVSWRTDLALGAWAPLTNGVAGTGDEIHVQDPEFRSQTSARFYRVESL